MKNIEAILKEIGIEVTDEQKTSINAAVKENYKPIADWQNQVDKVTTLTEKVTTTEDALKKFDGVDLDGLKGQIEQLKTDLAQKDTDYQTKIAERDFSDLLKTSILSAKGKDAEKISKLLNVDELKASKNQKEDIEKAINALAEDDVTKGMFGDKEPEVSGQGNIIGHVSKPNGDSSFDAQMRSVMGLPPITTQSKGE